MFVSALTIIFIIAAFALSFAEDCGDVTRNSARNQNHL